MIKRAFKQPQGTAALNLDNPVTRGVRAAFCATIKNYDLARNLWATTPGATTVNPSSEGVALTGAASIGTFSALSLPANTNTTTLVIYGQDATGHTNGRIWSKDGSNFLINSPTGRPWFRFAGTDIQFISGPQITTASRRAAVYRSLDGVSVDAWWDGAQKQYSAGAWSWPALTISLWGTDNSEWCGEVAGLVFWDRYLADQEAAALTLDPWSVFSSARRSRKWISVGGAVTTINASQGAWTWAGQASTLATQLAASQGAWSWAGQAAALSTQIAAAVGAYSWAGQTATFATQLAATQGAYSWSGVSATFSSQIAAAQGAFTWAGQPATISVTPTINAAAGQFIWAGQSATFATQIAAGAGAWTWVAQSATIPPAAGGTPIRMTFSMASRGGRGQVTSHEGSGQVTSRRTRSGMEGS